MPSRRRYPPSVATGDGGGSTVQDPEGFRNRRETRRGIHWASVSTVIAAVIGAVVGSLGGAYLGVAVGADRDDERADREFWRTQRITVYGEFLAATEETRSLMFDASFVPDFDGGIEPTIAEYEDPSDQSLAAVQASMERVRALVGQLSFLSEDVAPFAEALKDELYWAEILLHMIDACHHGDVNSWPCNVTPDQYPLADVEDEWWMLGQFESDRENFMRAAHAQLDAPD
jgi:hypothetical protein